nr:uncharacterized protein LOC103455519 [Malus domestica]XP_028955318.1 uncharacterized protein LOC103455519 [Malus domestica]XP_028955319.1 uncharacterized protein LOC103455519 [Malus domestica]
MTVSSQDVKKKSFIHKIFTTKEKEGSSSSDCSAPLQALEVFAQIGAQKRQILWNKWSQRSRLHCAVAAQDPVGLGLPLEDDVVLIVGHFRDSSEQRIRFPSSNDCVCGKENSGRVEDPRRICQVNANAAKWTKASISTSCCNTQLRSQIGGKQFRGTSSSNWVIVFFLHL